MPNTIQNITVPTNLWVDLYALAGLAVGTQLIIENSGDIDVYLAVQAVQPGQDHDAYNIVKRRPSISLQNTQGDAGAWAYCPGGAGKLSISSPTREGFGSVARASLHDGFGRPINSLGGAIDVHVADIHSSIINQHIHQNTGISTTLAAAAAVNDYQVTVSDTTGFTLNDYIRLDTSFVEPTHLKIVGVAGNVLTLDRRLDKAHIVGDEVRKVIIDMALSGQPVGTLAAPQKYIEGPPSGEIWHITRLLFTMVHGTAGDLGLFGNLPALTNGVLLRTKVGSQYGTLTNWKTNADIKTDMFDVHFDVRSGGQGSYGTSGRGTFAETGAVLRLNGSQGDQFEVYIQDDIRALGFFAMKIQGHIEEA